MTHLAHSTKHFSISRKKQQINLFIQALKQNCTPAKILTVNHPEEFNYLFAAMELKGDTLRFIRVNPTEINTAYYNELLEEAEMELEMEDLKAAKALIRLAGLFAFGRTLHIQLKLQIADFEGDTALQKALLNQLIRLEGHQAIWYAKRAELLVQMAHYRGAKEDYDKAISLDRENAQYRGDLAVTHYLSMHSLDAAKEASVAYELSGKAHYQQQAYEWKKEAILELSR